MQREIFGFTFTCFIETIFVTLEEGERGEGDSLITNSFGTVGRPLWYSRSLTVISSSEPVGQILPVVEYYWTLVRSFQLSIQVVPVPPELLCQVSKGTNPCCDLVAPNDHFSLTCWLRHVICSGLTLNSHRIVPSHKEVRSQICNILQTLKEKVWKEMLVVFLPWMKYWMCMILYSFCVVAHVVKESDKMRYETLCLSSLFSRRCDTIIKSRRLWQSTWSAAGAIWPPRETSDFFQFPSTGTIINLLYSWNSKPSSINVRLERPEAYIYIYIQSVPRLMVTTSGEYSLGQTIPI